MKRSHDLTTGFAVRYDANIEKACTISLQEISQSMGRERLGFRGCLVAQKGYEDGVWLYDALRTFNDAIIYCISREQAEDHLYARQPGSWGVIPFFGRYQVADGPYAGNIPVAVYVPWKAYPPGYKRRYDIDYGGNFDHTFSPRKNHQDELAANSIAVRSMLRYWQFYDDVSYVREYYDLLSRYAGFRARSIDDRTGLYRSSFGLADVAVNTAVPRSCALVYSNAECMKLFEEFAALACALGEEKTASTYEALAGGVREGMNADLWSDDLNHYTVKVFERMVTDPRHPFYTVTEDRHFFVNDNIVAYAFDVPDTEARRRALRGEIERVDGGRRLYGTSVAPPYPDGLFHKVMDGGNYWNGCIWPVRGTQYATRLFAQGHPELAMKVLARHAAIIDRDNGFYEYYGTDDEAGGRGAFNNCFSASPLVAAIVQGLFGLNVDYPKGLFRIHPSLTRSGSIRCNLGLHGFEMNVEMGPPSQTVTLSIKTSYDGMAGFRVLLPEGVSASGVLLNGTGLPCATESIGEGTYAVFEAPLAKASLRIVIEGSEDAPA